MGLKESRKCNLQVTGDRTKWQKKNYKTGYQEPEIKNWNTKFRNLADDPGKSL